MLDGRGGNTLFVASYGADGEPRWARTMGNPSETSQAFGVTADAAGNVYACGSFAGETIEEDVTLISNGGVDAFIGSYTVDGFQRWVRSFGGVGLDSATSVVVDDAGNPVFVGSVGVDSMVDFGDGTPIGSGGFTPFVLSLSAAGDFRWVRGGDGGRGELNGLEAVTIGPSGRIHAAGRASRVDLGLGELTATGEHDILYATYSEVGMVEDAALFGGAADEEGHGIAVGPTGRVYILAEYGGGATDVGYGPAENESGGGDVVFFEVR